MLNWIKNLSKPIQWFIGAALTIILVIFVWWMFISGWNKVSDYLFHRKEVALQEQSKKDKIKIEEQQKAIDQTILQLAESEKRLAEATKARQEAERIFNDSTKTSQEKVKAFKEALAAAPVHTDPSTVTDDELCTRAKAAGSSPAVIAALCPK